MENHESYNFYYSAFCVTWSTWSAVCSLIMSLMYPGSVAKKRVMSTVRRTRVVALSALDQNPPHVNRLGPVMWGRTQFRGEVGWGDFRGIRGEFRSGAPDLSIFLSRTHSLSLCALSLAFLRTSGSAYTQRSQHCCETTAISLRL